MPDTESPFVIVTAVHNWQPVRLWCVPCRSQYMQQADDETYTCFTCGGSRLGYFYADGTPVTDARIGEF